ncbi:MAG: hypothetical protein Q9157_007030 [Trypethelium eluteriae]
MDSNYLGNHESPLDALLDATAPDFKTFFQWFFDIRNIRKLSALVSNWKNLRGYYLHRFSKPIDSDLGDDVLNARLYYIYPYSVLNLTNGKIQFIHNDLRSCFNLDVSKRSKPILSVDDLVDILLHHWKFSVATFCDERQRVQVALLLLVAAYTGSRPSTILNTSVIEQTDSLLKTKAICYRHIQLYLVKSETPTERAKVVVLLTLPYGKGDSWKPQPKTFLFYENPNLLLCPVALILSLAFDDHAFEASGANTRKILNAQVPQHKQSIQLCWKQGIKDIPIMRESYMTEGVATAAERDQIMGHSDSTIFQFYLTQKVKCDVQAAFLDEPKNSTMLKTTGAMRFTADSHAPTALTWEQRNTITNSPIILSMTREVEALTQAKKKYQSSYEDKARLDQLTVQHQEATRRLKAQKVREERDMLRNLRAEHFETSDTRELERQFAGVQAQKSDSGQTDKPIYDVPERRRIVAVLHVTAENMQMAPLDRFRYRVDFIDNLTLLCKRRDPRNRGHRPEIGLRRLPGSRIGPFFPLKTNQRQCLFCLGDKKLTLKKRGFLWSTPYKMWDHIESKHLCHMAPNKGFTCPHPQCLEDGIGVADVAHFKNHAARIHGVLLRARRN